MAGVTNQNNRHNAFFSPFSVDNPNRVVVTNAQGYAIASEVSYQDLLNIVNGGGSVMGAVNGLTVDGGVVKLGGTLIESTAIDFNGQALSFANVTSGLSSDSILLLDGLGAVKKIAGSTYALASRILNINGNDYDLSADREWRVAQADTGCLTCVGLTANSGTTINIGAVTGYVVDNETDPDNPVYTKITYAGETNKTVTTVGSGLSTYVMLGIGGVISFQNTFPSSAERKAKIWLGKVGHPTGVITTVINEPDFITSPQAFSRDLFQALGPYINNNVYPYANGANLSVNITAGSIRGNGINFVGSVANRQDPDKLAVGPFTPLSFLYRTRTGAGGTAVTLIDPTNYDLGGVITPIGGGVNRSTIQYIFCIPGVGFVIQYGQNIYNTLTDAISFIGRESFTVFSNLPDNAILIGVLALKRSATALNDTTQAQFFNADKLGQIIGATSGVSTGTMQTGYNNSLQPQISVTDTLGSVIYKNARALDTSTVFEVQNIAGTANFSVTGNGLTTIRSGAEALKIGTNTGNPDHAYLGFYARTASPTTQSGYVGYNGVGSTTLSVVNSIASGNLLLGSGSTSNIQLFGATRNVTIQNGGTFTDNGYRLEVQGTARITGNTTVGINTSIFPVLNINGGITNRDLAFQTASVLRWIIRANDTPEGGSNAGSNLQIINLNDAGGFISTPFFIERSTGNIGIGTTTTTASVLTIGASTTAKASLNIIAGVAPTTPNNGDVWFDGANLKMRVAGVTKTFTLV